MLCTLPTMKCRNFKQGKKLPLDFSPERWNLAIHIIDAVFYVERKCMSVGFQESSRAHTILHELEGVISVGYELRALQKLPHLVLLNEEWYKSHMMPVAFLFPFCLPSILRSYLDPAVCLPNIAPFDLFLFHDETSELGEAETHSFCVF